MFIRDNAQIVLIGARITSPFHLLFCGQCSETLRLKISEMYTVLWCNRNFWGTLGRLKQLKNYVHCMLSGDEWYCVWKSYWTCWKEPSAYICTLKKRNKQNCSSHQRFVSWEGHIRTFLEGRFGKHRGSKVCYRGFKIGFLLMCSYTFILVHKPF